MTKNLFQVDFSIKGLSLAQQNKLFQEVIKNLDYNARQNLHITVTDYCGGKHFIWEGSGVDPNGNLCSKCTSVCCENCPTLSMYQKTKIEKEN